MTTKRGRRTTLPTPAVVQQICAAIRGFATARDACALAGVPESTYYLWLKKAESEEAGPFLEFLEAITRARISRTTALVARISTAGREPRHWQANAWLLERLEPRRFGLRIRHHVEEELGSALKRLEEGLPEDEYERALLLLSGGRVQDEH